MKMATESFELRVFADREGRTRVTLVDPAGKAHEPVVLTLHGEQALYRLMAHVRPEARPLEVLEKWEPNDTERLSRSIGTMAANAIDVRGSSALPSLDPADIEEAIEKCGF